MTDRWLAVGLGNPGRDLSGTRHNVGAEVVEVLAGRAGTQLSTTKRIRCRTAELRRPDHRLVLAVPTSYMNESGGPVQSAVAWYQIPTEQLVVVHDEIDLPLGTIRVKLGGGSAGHNGLRDIDRRLGTSDYLRVRIGVGRPPGRLAARDHVLRRFSPKERDSMDVTVEHAADAVDSLITDGVEPTQNRYHGQTW